MEKAYDEIIWQDEPSEETPITAENLNEMSHALDVIDDRVIDLDTNKLDADDVDDELSPTSENPVQNKVIYDTLQNILPEETAEGNPISITDASGLSAKSCEVTMNPIQDLHGYENPWPAGGGKNKLPMTLSEMKTKNTSGSWNGNIYTLNGSTFTVYTLPDNETVIKITTSGTPSATTSFTVGNMSYTEGIPEIMNGCPSDGSSSKYQLVSSNSSAVGYDRGRGVTINPSETVTADIKIYLYSGYDGNSLDWYPMIRLSTVTDPTFEPYSNICPISGRDGLNLYQAGVNLANTTIYKQGYVLGSDGSESVSANYCITDKCIVTGGKKYVLRWKENSGTVSDNVVRIGWYKSNGDFISRTAPTNTSPYITAPTNTAYCKLSYNNIPSSDNYKWDIMLNEGETALDYVPYQGETHTKTFTDTVYGGSHEFVSGKLTSSHGIIDLSTKNWTYNSTYSVFIAYVTDKKAGGFNIICDSYKLSDVSFSTMPDLSIVGNTSSNAVYIKNTNYDGDSLNAFKNSLNGVYACYELATPNEITLTPETIALLKGNNVLFTDGDNITLKYSADIKEWVLAQLQS